MSRQTSVPTWVDLDRVAATFIDWRWDDKAACTHGAGVNFFPERGQPTAPAKAVCRGCPVIYECLTEALSRTDHEDGGGVWGCTSQDERRAIRVVLRHQQREQAA